MDKTKQKKQDGNLILHFIFHKLKYEIVVLTSHVTGNGFLLGVFLNSESTQNLEQCSCGLVLYIFLIRLILEIKRTISSIFFYLFLNTVILVWWCVFFKSWADKKKRKQVKSRLFLSWQNKTFESNWKVCYFVSWLSFYSSFFLHL